MDNIRYYFSIFRRRFSYFLVVAVVISAASIIAAMSLPPAYESRAVLVMESPQIPEELAASTVQAPAYQQLQLVQQHLLARENMLDVAYKLKAFPKIDEMNPDAIVAAMRARTTIRAKGARRGEAPIMTIQFEASNPRIAAGVLNDYLVLIQARDAEFRRGRSGETLDFFVREVDRLSAALDAQSKRILEFKQKNSDALPESLEFRLSQQSVFQDRITQVDRDVSDLNSQRDRLKQLYELTGNVETPLDRRKTPEEAALEAAENELADALAIYSATNPRVKVLQARVDRLLQSVSVAAQANLNDEDGDTSNTEQLPAVLAVQLSEVDSRVAALMEQKIQAQERLKLLDASISRTPEVSIILEEMEREYGALEGQYAQAQDRLAKAQTGDQIETRARGQRLSVIEQPSVPTQPTKPNRIMIAGGGTSFGILLGLGLIVLLEMLNSAPRRPEDIVSKLGITPLTTIPYVQTQGQQVRLRLRRIVIALLIALGVPAAIYMVHIHYLPLDLIADKIMNKLGVRW